MNLTEEEIKAVRRGEPVMVSTPEAGDVVVISTQLYDRIHDLLADDEDRELQQAWLKATARGRAALLKSDPC